VGFPWHTGSADGDFDFCNRTICPNSWRKSGIAVGVIVVMFAATMFFCDRLPQRLVFRLGILGWVLTFAMGFWYFKTHGP
jgi:hypothetical protein